MFERLTDEGRQVIKVAHDEARQLRHPQIGTEHLLLGLVNEAVALRRRLLISPSRPERRRSWSSHSGRRCACIIGT